LPLASNVESQNVSAVLDLDWAQVPDPHL